MLCHNMVARLPFQFGNELGPIGRRVEGMRHIGAARRAARYIHQDDGQAVRAKGTGQRGRPRRDVRARMRCRQGDEAFLKINHDQSGFGVQLCQWHG
jgi:hypothetical protein